MDDAYFALVHGIAIAGQMQYQRSEVKMNDGLFGVFQMPKFEKFYKRSSLMTYPSSLELSFNAIFEL